jgi:hypothetical protein
MQLYTIISMVKNEYILNMEIKVRNTFLYNDVFIYFCNKYIFVNINKSRIFYCKSYQNVLYVL